MLFHAFPLPSHKQIKESYEAIDHNSFKLYCKDEAEIDSKNVV
jgi:hypothetical protein